MEQNVLNSCTVINSSSFTVNKLWDTITSINRLDEHPDTLKEHQQFLTKTEMSLISDKGFTMEVYGDFRF